MQWEQLFAFYTPSNREIKNHKISSSLVISMTLWRVCKQFFLFSFSFAVHFTVKFRIAFDILKFLQQFSYEMRIYGCSIETKGEGMSKKDLNNWVFKRVGADTKEKYNKWLLNAGIFKREVFFLSCFLLHSLLLIRWRFCPR